MEGAIDTLTKTVLGSLVVVLLVGVVALYRALIAEKDKRLADTQQQAAKVTEAFNESSRAYQIFAEKIEAAKRGKR